MLTFEDTLSICVLSMMSEQRPGQEYNVKYLACTVQPNVKLHLHVKEFFRTRYANNVLPDYFALLLNSVVRDEYFYDVTENDHQWGGFFIIKNWYSDRATRGLTETHPRRVAWSRVISHC